MPYKNREDKLAYSKRYNRKHYAENKEYYVAKRKRRRVDTKKWIKDYKLNLKCSKCPETFWACLEFHHISDNKEFQVSNATKAGWNREKILAEIAKCAVLCANCHRKEHYP